MSKFHLLDKLTTVIEKIIKKLNVTMENILLVLNLVNNYKSFEGFEVVTEPLEAKIVVAFAKLTMKDQYKFFKLHRADNQELINALVDLMADTDLVVRVDGVGGRSGYTVTYNLYHNTEQ